MPEKMRCMRLGLCRLGGTDGRSVSRRASDDATCMRTDVPNIVMRHSCAATPIGQHAGTRPAPPSAMPKPEPAVAGCRANSTCRADPRAPPAIATRRADHAGRRRRKLAVRHANGRAASTNASPPTVANRRQAGRQRRADMGERHHEGRFRAKIQHHAADRRSSPACRVAAGEEGRAPAPSPARRPAAPAHRPPATATTAVRSPRLKAPRPNSTRMIGYAADDQRQRRRQRQEQRIFDRAVQRAGRRPSLARRAPAATAAAAAPCRPRCRSRPAATAAPGRRNTAPTRCPAAAGWR